MITKQHFQTDTVAFRLAISLAALWLLWTGYQVASRYKTLIEANEAYRDDPSRYEKCYAPVKIDDPDAIVAQWRLPTFDERNTCRNAIDDVDAYIDARTSWWTKLITERNAIWRFTVDGLIPVGITLLIVAMWGQIATVTRRYVNWLKNGRAASEADSQD